MLARLGLVIAIVACGGSKPPPAAPAKNHLPVLEEKAEQEPPPAPPPQPAPPPVEAKPTPPPLPKKPLFERLRDSDGNVAGLPGFALQRKPDPKRCGGVLIVTKRTKKVGKDDAPLAAVYKLEFPSGLSFDPDPKNAKKKQASLKKF